MNVCATSADTVRQLCNYAATSGCLWSHWLDEIKKKNMI